MIREARRDDAGESPPARKRWRRVFVIGTMVMGGIGILLFAGCTGGFVTSKTAVRWLESLIAWWVVFGIAVAVIPNFRRFRLHLLTAAVAAVICLALVEIALRTLRLPYGLPPLATQSSVEYHHVNPPDAEMFQGRIDGQNVVIRTNSDGLRTKYTPSQFHAFKHRVVVIGDSFAFGFGVPDESTVTERIEARLRESLGSEDVAVLNAGIISSSPLLQRAFYDGVVAKYRPTAVVQILDPTDFGDDWTYQKAATPPGGPERFDVTPSAKPPNLGRIVRLTARVWRALIHPLSAVSARLHPKPSYSDFEYSHDGQVETNRFFIFRRGRDVTAPLFEATLQNVHALAGEVDKSGSHFLLVLNARYPLWGPAQCPHNWEKGQYGPDDPFADDYLKFMEEAQPRVPFGIHSLLPDLRGAAHEQLVFETDPHWNAKGNDVAADSIARTMLARKMVR